ncbi:MAG TPA: MYXO-CTERM sorting domain-containing protein, partial [Polyangiaceae bacterium]|nr:MYXO-CTERM sorting domain-containing protein [Polyangiaceae bacterium]
SDGVDDDGDGLSDYPNDPGCTSADDVNEVDGIACADGIDNDGDGQIDFPADIGCTSSLDQTEENALDVGAGGTGTGGSGAGGSSGASTGAGSGSGGSSLGGLILVQGDTPTPDLGSVPEGSALSPSGSNSDDGCSCRLAEPNRGASGAFGTLLAAALLLARRRRQP